MLRKVRFYLLQKKPPPIIGNVNKAVTEQQINLPAPGVLAGRAKIQDKPFRPESNSAFNKRVKEERAYREQKVRENEGSKRFEEMNREEVARKRFEDLSKKDAEKYTPLKGYFGTQKQWEKLVDSVGEEKARKSVLPEMKVYHGTSKSNANNISKEGFKLGKGKYVSKEYPELFKGQEGFVSFTADSAAGQKLYAQSKGRLVEAKIAKNAKVVEYQSLPKQLRERIELLSEVGSLSNKKEREMIFGKDKRIFINGKDSGFTSGASSNFRVETFAEISGLLEKYAKENGVDAIKFGDIQFPQHQIDKNEIRVFNPDVIQTEKTGNSPSRPPSKDIKEAEKSVDKFQKVYHVTPKKSMAERIKNSGLKSSENGNGEAGAYVWKNLDDAKEYNDSLYDGKGQIVELSVPDVDYKKLIKDDSQGISDFANDSAHYFRGDLRSRKQLVEEIINTGKISPGKPVKNPARMRQETAGKNDAKAILKLQSDLDAMESMAKARPVVPAEKDTFFGSPWLERFTKAEYEKRSKLIDKINNLEARQEYKKLSKPSRPPKKPPQQAYGAVAGVEPEYDEQGNMKGVKFDPAKAAMGVGLMAGGDKLSKTEAFKGLSGLSTKIIEKLKGRTSVSKQFISDLTNSGDVKQVERDLIRQVLETEKDDVIDVVKFADKVKVELLPLEVFSSGDTRLTGGGYSGKDMRTLSARYENITLPSEIRGDVKNYKEKIYESPIETSAGNQHYPQMTKNYYGHTRTEDMAPVWKVGDTTYTSKKSAEIYGQPVEQPNVRRVIEVQSDLYQKGKLDREYQTFASEKTLPEYVNFKGEKYKLLSGHDAIGVVGEIPSNVKIQSPNGTKKWVSFDKLKEQNSELFNAGQDKIKELDKLKQYNDPTAHFRMIREEVKQASADGVGKLQFPTGETAMKIEGLGASPMSLSYVDEFGQAIGEVTKNNLKVGKIYRGLNVSGDWVITDVLGEGKFRAISKDTIASYPKAERERIMKGEKPQHPNWLDFSNRQSETFDISGKVDTDNPIYKFYEKEVGKYLKNKYNATLITDDKGVTWWQMDVKPEYGKLPVEAFGIAALAGGTGMAFRPPKRDEK